MWLVLAGTFTWQRSRESVVPPLWDQQTYVQKADAVWTSLLKGTGENPLNVEPTVRPPGTVLLTAPLGPLRDFRDFYFRSAFVPVAIMVAAVFLAGFGVTRRGWESALIALLAGSLPMFWQFEIGDVHNTGLFWGMVDTFQASLSALAMAGLLVAALKFRYLWLIPALAALVLIPLVKPSGFLVGAFLSVAWFFLGVRFAGLHPQGWLRGGIGVVATGLGITAALGVTALASFTSEYCSKRNIEFGKAALAQLRADWATGYATDSLPVIFSGVIGLPILGAVALMGSLAFTRREKYPHAKYAVEARWAAWMGVAVFIAGVALCYQATLFRQTRYVFPFLSVAIVLMVPILVDWSRRAGRAACLFVSVIPIALLVLLMVPGGADTAFRFGAYGLFTGYGQDEVRAANAFVGGFRADNGSAPVLFTTSDTNSAAAFEAAFAERLRKDGLSHLQAARSVTRPLSWETGAVVRIDAVYNADILVLGRHLQVRDTDQRDSFRDELAAWVSWLTKTPVQGSTTIVLETPKMIALAIKDRGALAREMRSFIASGPWRPEFLEANRPTEFSAAEVQGLVTASGFLKVPVLFGDAIRLHALNAGRVAETSEVRLDVYTERKGTGAGRSFSVFVHQLDEQGRTIANHEILLSSSRFADRPISLSTTTLQLLPATRQLALGIFEPSVGSLVTDWPLATDWGGRRARIDVNALAEIKNPGQ